jgi:hypothetical protein
MKPKPTPPTLNDKPDDKPLDNDKLPPPGDLPQSETDLTAQGESTSPHMPHERDEKVGMTGGVPNEQVQQGARDLARGLQDTSRAEETDRAYQSTRKPAPR